VQSEAGGLSPNRLATYEGREMTRLVRSMRKLKGKGKVRVLEQRGGGVRKKSPLKLCRTAARLDVPLEKDGEFRERDRKGEFSQGKRERVWGSNRKSKICHSEKESNPPSLAKKG